MRKTSQGPLEADTALLFLAHLINERRTREEGYTVVVRWLCLREDLQETYLAEAQTIVEKWWADEKRAEAERDSHTWR